MTNILFPPTTWKDDVEHRRRLAEAIRQIVALMDSGEPPAFDIGGLATSTTLDVSADYVAIWNADLSVHEKVAASDVGVGFDINALPTTTTLDIAVDYLAFYNSDLGIHEKTLVEGVNSFTPSGTLESETLAGAARELDNQENSPISLSASTTISMTQAQWSDNGFINVEGTASSAMIFKTPARQPLVFGSGVINPGAELADTSGWSVEILISGSALFVATTSDTQQSAPHTGTYFFTLDMSNGQGQAVQTVDLNPLTNFNPTNVDNGDVWLDFELYQSWADDGQPATFDVQALLSAGGDNGTIYTSGEVSAGAANTWTQRASVVQLPALTRQLKVKCRTKWAIGPSMAWDDVKMDIWDYAGSGLSNRGRKIIRNATNGVLAVSVASESGAVASISAQTTTWVYSDGINVYRTTG